VTLEWTDEDQQEADDILGQIDTWMNNATSRQGALLTGSLASICNQNLVPAIWTHAIEGVAYPRCKFWIPYLRTEKTMSSFFSDWLYYTPIPGKDANPKDGAFTRNRFERRISGPGYYIELYDFIANTIPGRELNFNNQEFADWMVRFLNIHGKYLQTASSVAPYKENNNQDVTPGEIWIDYVAAGQHPYNISAYIVPEGGFKDYTQIFLRNLQAGSRPVGEPDNAFGIS
jgi:hypothetical protein